ncbi:hypothetical protein S83_059782, partial [Arachis hypogaea]
RLVIQFPAFVSVPGPILLSLLHGITRFDVGRLQGMELLSTAHPRLQHLMTNQFCAPLRRMMEHRFSPEAVTRVYTILYTHDLNLCFSIPMGPWGTVLQSRPPSLLKPNYHNHESSVERDDIKEIFSELSMFKKNYDHLPKDIYFGNYKDFVRGNPNYFLTYENGKSAACIQDHLRPNGAHRWDSYMKSP